MWMLIAGAVWSREGIRKNVVGFAIFNAFLPLIVGADWAAIILHHWWFGLPYALLYPFGANLNLFFMATGQPRLLLLSTVIQTTLDTLLGAWLAGW